VTGLGFKRLFPALSEHVLVGTDTDCHATRRRLEGVLRDQFEIENAALQQVEHEGGDLLDIQLREAAAS
jgi:hypothetical protein